MTRNTRLIVTVVLAAVIAMVLLFVAEVASEDEMTAFTQHMHGHLDQVSAAKAGVIAGDLQAARDAAEWLAEHDEPTGMPDAWAPYLDDMRQHARVAANAQDLETAAVAVSEIARACGDCHRATGFDVAFGFDQRPPADVQNVMTQMQRHLWAADRMWEGLIGPSNQAWKSGTEMLAEVQLSSEQVSDDPASAAQVDPLIKRIHAIGTEGSQAESSPSRAGLYGEFLSQCANCHRVTGGGPAA
jgi:hypothetical protein